MIEKEIIDFISDVMLIPSSEVSPGEKFLVVSHYDFVIIRQKLEEYGELNKKYTNSDNSPS